MPDSRPNIIYIITDEQRFDTIAALGFPYMDTPNIDRLVKEGISFTNCFVTAPTCAPSRASIFTGYYPHTTGIYKNSDTWRHSWVEQLSEAGYYCVNVGKMHTCPFETPLGFHERFVVENKDRYLEGRYFLDRWDMALHAQGLVKQQRELYRLRNDYRDCLGAFEWELPENMHPDFFVGDTAAWWIKHKPKTEPLFMQIGFPGPHPPFDPVPRYSIPYLNKEIPLPEVSCEELNAQNPALKGLIDHNCQVDHDSVVWKKNPTREQLKRMRAYYFANVTMIDEKIGEIINALENKGYLDRSIIIFTSDHGDCLGDHGQIEKWNMFEQVTKVPMIVWAPGYLEGGKVKDCLCQSFDVGPFILEMAGVQVPETFEAKSLRPILKGETEGIGREYVFCEQGRDIMIGPYTDQITMVRSKAWKLVHYLGNDYGELYDMKADPGEHKNLWDESSCAQIKQNLLNEILKWQMKSSLKTANYNLSWR